MARAFGVTIGYIVVQRMGGMHLDPGTNVLWHGRVATLFGDRRVAKSAIARTIDYRRSRMLPWDEHYQIQRVATLPANGSGRRAARRSRA